MWVNSQVSNIATAKSIFKILIYLYCQKNTTYLQRHNFVPVIYTRPETTIIQQHIYNNNKNSTSIIDKNKNQHQQ